MSTSLRAMRTFTRAFASIACSSMLACSSTGCGPIKPDCYEPAHDACTGNRWVGILKIPAAACPSPTVGGWTSQKLFTFAQGMKPPDALTQYCLFTWSPPSQPSDCSSGPSNTEVAALVGFVGDQQGQPLSRVDEDCNVVVPQTLETTLQNQLRAPFEQAAGRVAPLPQDDSTMPPKVLTPVRISVIDTLHDWSWDVSGVPVPDSPPAGSHGYMVASHADDLACPGGPPCAGHVETRLGLALDQQGKPVLSGSDGISGSPSQLAGAIAAAVNQWRTDVLIEGEKRLVINISAGWNHGAGGHACNTNMADADAPARAVYDAARYAACHGAVILASAGNNTGGPNPASGLMCPAQLEFEALPSDTTCEALRPLTDDGTAFAVAYQKKTNFALLSDSPISYRRIVYAVGAGDSMRNELVPTRPNARPRLQAMGWGAVLPSGKDPTPLYGTSIASVVAASSVAVRWAYEPWLTYPEVMDSVYAMGVALSAPSSENACFAGAGSCGVHHVSVCHAINAVFPSLQCPNAAPTTLYLPDLASHFSSTKKRLVKGAFSPTTPNPLSQYPTNGSGSFVIPQPNWPECPACFFAQFSGNIYIYVSPLTNAQLNELTLVSTSGALELGSGVNGMTVFQINGSVAGSPFLAWKNQNGSSSFTPLPQAGP